MSLSDEVYFAARDLIANRLGLAFAENRRAELERALRRACRASAAATLDAYLAGLATVLADAPEWTRLSRSLTVGETYFFRDRAVFDALETHVLPPLIATRRAEGRRWLRLWSAGCATGEEAYSLAIVLDRLLADIADWSVTILATDINTEALEAARRGRYRAWSFRQTAESVRDRYFRPVGDLFELDSRLRRAVTFAPLNLAQDCCPSMVTDTTAMDVILCRNVLMYFTPEAQRAAVARLAKRLPQGGWLGVGAAEGSVEMLRPLEPVGFPGAFLYRKNAAVVAEPAPPPSPVVLVPWRDAGATPVSAPPPPPWHDDAAPEQAPTLALSPPAPGLGCARALADQGRLDEAHTLCRTVLARNPLDLEAHLLMAAVSQEQGAIRPALEALRRAIYLAPDCAAAHFRLGNLLLTQGDPERARRCMDTVVRLLSAVRPDEPVAGSDGLAAGRLLEAARACLAPS